MQSSVTSVPYGDSPAAADECLELVLAGRKTATCWAASEGVKGAEVGKRWIVKDGKGRPRAIVETVELTRRRFDEVDEAIAYDGGEGDRSLASWRRLYMDFLTRQGTFSRDMELCCERFRLVEVLDCD